MVAEPGGETERLEITVSPSGKDFASKILTYV
jgi:hypothetical protein